MATISEPFTMDFATGYREDHLKIRLHLPGNPSSIVYEENYDHLRFVHSQVTLRTIQRDLYLYANGGYAAIGTGDLKQGQIPLTFSPDVPQFRFDTSGFAGDVLGILGYAVDLTPGRYYQVAFIPFFGYAYYYEKLKRKDPTPNPFEGSTFSGPPSFFTMTSSLPQDLVTEWRGFFIGGSIRAKPVTNVTFQVLYAYHFLHLDQTITSTFRIQQFSSPNVLSSDIIETNKAKLNKGGNHGHLGTLTFTYTFTPHISISALGKIWYFTTGTRDVTNRRTTDTLFPTPSTVTVDQDRKATFRHTSFYILASLNISL